MARMQAIYDINRSTPEQGETFFHCARCLKELPESTAPSDWARQQCAITPEGWLQVWCTRHDCNIALIRFEVREEEADAAPTA